MKAFRTMELSTIFRQGCLLVVSAAISISAISQKNKGLKDAYKKYFLIGAAINANQARQNDAVAKELVPRHFNVLTPENVMKAEIIHPQWDTYNFTDGDKLIEYAKEIKAKVVGHTLIWHSQLPRFARQLSADSLRLFMEQHITTVASRYKNDVIGWDVVNEALNEDGTLRKSVFLDKLGPDYLANAFKLAQQAAPGVELYYNDYNNEQPAKRAGCIDIVKRIQQAGARIDGVGIQGHWHVGKVPFKDIEESILAYAALGVKVMITELDLEVLPRNFTGAEISQRVASNPALNPYANGIPDSVLEQQAKDYAELFKLFKKHKDKITRVTFWGVHDGHSWLNGWPVAGRTNYPLLFSRKGEVKPAYTAIMAVAKK